MTNTTSHESLMDLIDAYAEARHRKGLSTYNVETQAARKAVIEALSGVQALSAAPAAPPAEQQAPKETLGGVNGWRDISTAPKDGSRFVAIGYNYGLYSEGRHIVVAQWFRGFWMETSDWNEASELTHLTHWLPLPSPPDNAAELNDLDVSVSPQQAAPKAAPGGLPDHQILAITIAYEQGVGKGRQAHESGKEIANPYGTGYRCDLAWQYGYEEGKEQAERIAEAAPQQEAQEPSHRETVDVVGVRSNGEHVNLGKIAMPPRMKAREIAIEQFGRFKDDDGSDAEMCFGALEYFLEWLIQQGWSKAPQPAPATLSDAVEHYLEAQDALDNREYGGINAEPYEKLLRRRSASRNDLDAAIAAQGGK